MKDFVYDNQGKTIAIIKEGELFDNDGAQVGTVRHNNVYDRNGKFIFHLQPVDGGESAGTMTAEAIHKLFHPK